MRPGVALVICTKQEKRELRLRSAGKGDGTTVETGERGSLWWRSISSAMAADACCFRLPVRAATGRRERGVRLGSDPARCVLLFCFSSCFQFQKQQQRFLKKNCRASVWSRRRNAAATDRTLCQHWRCVQSLRLRPPVESVPPLAASAFLLPRRARLLRRRLLLLLPTGGAAHHAERIRGRRPRCRRPSPPCAT